VNSKNTGEMRRVLAETLLRINKSTKSDSHYSCEETLRLTLRKAGVEPAIYLVIILMISANYMTTVLLPDISP